MSSPLPSRPSSDDGLTHERVEALLDFILEYQTDLAAGRVRSLDEYERRTSASGDPVLPEHPWLAQDPIFESPSSPSERKPRLAHYVLEREIGRGAQGHVYLATDLRMNRRVALKMLDHSTLTPDKLRRFRREVEVIAKLDHPGLCMVFEADLDGPRPYLAMRFVDGEDLGRKLKSARSGDGGRDLFRPGDPAALAQLLHLFERTARALHAAHEAGVVHRDVKPANILIDSNGEPVIVDFGLARGGDSEFAGLTGTDDVLGTPAYMAPEMLESGPSSADRRVDVYALGVALYECLTLERPFRAEHREALFQSILHGEYQDPRSLNPFVGEDLRVVVATAIEHQPARRYATALEFAEDLRRIREYEPIRARRVGWTVRLRRWSQRHPGLATAVMLVFVGLCLWSGTLKYTLGRVEAQSRRAGAERDRARAANSRLLGVGCREKSTALLSTDPGLALVLALEADRRDPGFESNMAVLHALQVRHEERTFAAGAHLWGTIDVSPDEGRVLLATSRSQGVVFDLGSSSPVTGSEIVDASHAGTLVIAAFSPDGHSFFVTDPSPGVRTFDTATGRVLKSFDGHSDDLTSCAFSPDGRELLTCSRDGRVRLFEADTGRLLRSVESPAGASTLARFDSTGSLILTSWNSRPDAASRGDGDPRVWDARTGRLLATLCDHTSPVRDACFSPDGETVWTAEVAGFVRVWEWRSARERWSVRLPGEAWCLAASPDGLHLAVGFEKGARVLDLTDGATAFDLDGLSERSVMAVAYSPDGRWIAAHDYGGNVGAWSASDGAARFRTRARIGQCSLHWLSDSRRFVSGSGGEHGHLWTIDPVPGLVELAPARSGNHAVRSAVFDGGSQFVLWAGDDGIVRTASARDGSPLHAIDARAGPIARAWFVPTGRVACLAKSGALVLVDTNTGERSTVRAPDAGMVKCSAIARGGGGVCFGLDDGRCLWLDTETGASFGAVDRPGRAIMSVAIDLSGTRAAWGAADGWAGVLERESGGGCSICACREGSYQSKVFTVAFVEDGRRLMTCGDHAGTKLWNARTGELEGSRMVRPSGQVAAIRGGGGLILAAKWAPQVFRIDDKVERLTWQIEQPSTGSMITGLSLSPDEQLLLTTSGEVALLSRALDGSPVLRFEHGTSALSCAEFSPDSRSVVTAAEDGSVRVWPIDVLGVARAHVASAPEDWPGEVPGEIEGP
jgi:serine/threonine protein kinase/WD40 repeat protein